MSKMNNKACKELYSILRVNRWEDHKEITVYDNLVNLL